ncbi:MAG: hypothetical protein J0I06_27625 [Planctomycetes bacterium]|nr:hypothetical protein [Planctomycetota bacterium]
MSKEKKVWVQPVDPLKRVDDDKDTPVAHADATVTMPSVDPQIGAGNSDPPATPPPIPPTSSIPPTIRFPPPDFDKLLADTAEGNAEIAEVTRWGRYRRCFLAFFSGIGECLNISPTLPALEFQEESDRPGEWAAACHEFTEAFKLVTERLPLSGHWAEDPVASQPADSTANTPEIA